MWHDRLGHVGPEVIDQLNKREDIAVDEGRGPMTNECESCALSKMKEQVSRRPPADPPERPFERLHMDLIIIAKAFDGTVCMPHISDEMTGCGDIFPLPSKREEGIRKSYNTRFTRPSGVIRAPLYKSVPIKRLDR